MITKNYIKMCEQAEEIQKSNINIGKRHFNNQDFVAYNCGEGLKVYVCSEISRYWLIDGLIWLPTQEQLQEIIWSGLDEYEHWISKLLDYILDLPFEPFSMNEIWLMFVMHERYNKIWTGEKWEKEK